MDSSVWHALPLFHLMLLLLLLLLRLFSIYLSFPPSCPLPPQSLLPIHPPPFPNPTILLLLRILLCVATYHNLSASPLPTRSSPLMARDIYPAHFPPSWWLESVTRVPGHATAYYFLLSTLLYIPMYPELSLARKRISLCTRRCHYI
jgi:hypothetical protein